MSYLNKILCLSFLSLNLSSEAVAETELSKIKVESNRVEEVTEVSGFSGVSVKKLPIASKVVSAEEMADARMQKLSDVIQADASATDSYNATGYWDFISVRGFTLDNRDNFQREGLLISAETSIPLNNKDRVEILKGLGAIQAGVASPGGLVNYVVKRPTEKSWSTFLTEISGSSNLLVTADASQRSESGQFGSRFNIAHEKLSPHLKHAQGQRSMLSLATEWRLPENSLLEFEVEWSHRSQQSQAGQSLLGDRLPEPVDPNVNLNHQPWVQPVDFRGLTGTLRYSQFLTSTTHWSAIVGSQALSTDDRMAYPFGCSSENNYDRFCSDGSFDVYDYRSENEKRQVDSAKVFLSSRIQTGTWEHNVTVGVLQGTFRERFQKQAYNYVGTGRIDGSVVLPENGALNDESTLRDSTTREIFLTDSVSWNQWQGWLGLRWGSLDRQSVRTDGSRGTQYHQSFPLPWLAVSYDLDDFLIYSSWGRGIETFVVPNKSGYLNPGEFIPGVVSEQVEIGLRGGDSDFNWNAAFFSTQRPLVEDQAPYYQVDGEAQHKGIELQASRAWNVWSVAGSAMVLDAKRESSTLKSALNGLRPINVPETVLRGQVGYQFTGLKGLSMNARVSHEGSRAVLADNSLMLPSWTQWDLVGKYEFSLQKIPTTLSFGVENLSDNKFWRESPTQYGHVYLYPGESRNFFLGLQATL